MTLLLLSGTGEAQQIARELAARDVDAIVSFAGESRLPKDSGLPVREGGFGGDAGFLTYLTAQGISAVLDATHPFAARITERTARICREQEVPYCRVLRPAWKPQPGDRWAMIGDEAEAADHIAPGATVFLATGRQSLERYANLAECENC